MARIVGLAQSKGGVSKTTTALNLAAELQRRGHTVAVLDADPMGNVPLAKAEAHNFALTKVQALAA